MSAYVGRRGGRVYAVAGILMWIVFTGLHPASADDTWTYAVQISASVQATPPRIVLAWPSDRYNPQSYTVYRKLVPDTSWGPGTTLPGTATGFTDTSVSAGVNYEYKVFKQGSMSYRGYGYICAGVQSPMIEDRGKLVLIVAADTGSLAGELARLVSDLTGDGWQVLRHDVSSGASPASVRSLIQGDYAADPTRVKAVFLLGSVPLLMSGDLEYDSHGHRPMPADAFYGDMNGDWHPDWAPSSRPSYLPSDVELMVGRVDFSNMPGDGAPSPWPSETELLRRYLNKDHAWRHKQFTVPRRALMANRVGDAGGMAYAASGYRNFEPFVGPGNIAEADVSDGADDANRWISIVSRGAWLWTYACGGGQMNVVSHMGTHGTYKEAWSTDLVAQDAKAVFSMIFGSNFGEWSGRDNLLRAMLAAPSTSLTVCLVGLPHWFAHHMAKGEPIGYATRLTMNNSTLYENHSNLLTRSVMVNLLGDPALRMEQISPPLHLSASGANGTASLNWTPAAEPVLGYHVYRSASPQGPFTRITSAPVTATSYGDSSPFGSATRTYMVRSLALQENPSGSYYNLSQGAFATVNVDGTIIVPPETNSVTATVAMTSSGPRIRWNTVSGKRYHVEGMVLIYNNDWVNLSGSMQAAGTELEFTDANWIWYWTRFYRIITE